MAALEIPRETNWQGYYVAIGEIEYKDKVTLSGVKDKDPIKSYDSGGILFQGDSLIIKDKMIIKEVKFMLENVKETDEITVTGPAIGVIRNCPKIKSLASTENTEYRILRSKIEEKLTIEKASGEIVETEVKQKTTFEKSGLILRDNKFKDDLSIVSSYIIGSQLEVEKEVAIGMSYAQLYDIKSKDFTLLQNNLSGFKFDISNDFLDANSILTISDVKVGNNFMLAETDISGFKFDVTKDVVFSTVDAFISEVYTQKDFMVLDSRLFASNVGVMGETTFSEVNLFGAKFQLEKEVNLVETNLFGVQFNVAEDISMADTNIFGAKFALEKEVNLGSSDLVGINFTVGKGLALEESNLTGSKFTIGTSLSLMTSNLIGSKFKISSVTVLSDSVARIGTLEATDIDLQASSLVTNVALVNGVQLDGASSLIGAAHYGSVISQGSVLLSCASGDVGIQGGGIVGIGLQGNSNFSSLQGGVDILAVPRINNRTADDFIVEAAKSIYLEAGSNFLAKAGAKACVVAGSDLLCDARGTMNLCAGGTQLLQGSSLFCVGMCKFTPSDRCTATPSIGPMVSSGRPCGKPVWLAGSTSKSVTPPTVPN